VSAADFLPSRITLRTLRDAAASCRGCSLYRRATQTVFGTGRVAARVVLVGEQPGNEEDLRGKPFVGPAGRLLGEALEAAGIAGAGGAKTSSQETERPRNWCLYALARERARDGQAGCARVSRSYRRTSAAGTSVRVSPERGKVMLRRQTSADRRRNMARLIADLEVVAGLLNGRSRCAFGAGSR